MALPLVMVKNLQIRTTTKFGLVGVFSLVIFVIAFDILRTTETLGDGGTGGRTALWTDLESAVAVIVSSLPSFAALLNRKKRDSVKRNTSPYPARSLAMSDSAKHHASASGSTNRTIEVHEYPTVDSDRDSRTASSSTEILSA